MTTKPKQSIADRLAAARLAIEGAMTDPEIQAALSVFGYDQARIEKGLALYQETRSLNEAQMARYGDQYDATANMNSAFEIADSAFAVSRRIARIAMKDNPKALGWLRLNESRKKSFAKWAVQAEAFYNNLLAEPALIAEMGRFGYDQSRLEAEVAQVRAAISADVTQEGAKGQAQEGTLMRDEELDALDEWMSDFKAIARIALTDNPQRLEKLGFGAV